MYSSRWTHLPQSFSFSSPVPLHCCWCPSPCCCVDPREAWRWSFVSSWPPAPSPSCQEAGRWSVSLGTAWRKSGSRRLSWQDLGRGSCHLWTVWGCHLLGDLVSGECLPLICSSWAPECSFKRALFEIRDNLLLSGAPITLWKFTLMLKFKSCM